MTIVCFLLCVTAHTRARYLLHLSISYHTFQLTSRGHLPQEAAGEYGCMHSLSIVYHVLYFVCYQSILLLSQLF